MPEFYGRHLTRTLKEAVDELTSAPPSEQLGLAQEIALLRDCAGQAVALYGAARDSGKPELVMAAAVVMRDYLAEVIRACEAWARVDAHSKDKFSATSLAFFVAQVARCAHEAFGDLPDTDPRLAAFQAGLAKIKLPAAAGGAQGTTLTPDQDATDMDGTVP